MQAHDRLVVAADLSSRADILTLVEELREQVGVVKIGLQAFIANGPGLVREIVSGGVRVFLDLKIHDIPNTAANAVTSAASLGASMITIHASGGEAMLRAAAGAAGQTLVLGVTILTSLDESQLRRIGFAEPPQESAVRLAVLARECGLGGVVASPHEIRVIRERCGTAPVIVTPG